MREEGGVGELHVLKGLDVDGKVRILDRGFGNRGLVRCGHFMWWGMSGGAIGETGCSGEYIC